MSVYRDLLRLYFAAQMQSRRSWGLAILFCLASTFLFGQSVVFCFWVMCFLLFVYTLPVANQYLLTRLPVERRHIVSSHYCYCLLLDALLCLIFWIVSNINPWQPGAGLPHTQSLLLLFCLSLFYYGLGFYLYYRGFRYATLYYTAGYILVLALVNPMDNQFMSEVSPLFTWIILAISLLAYGGFCRLSGTYFAYKDLL